MKKILFLLFALTFVGFMACSDDDGDNGGNTGPTEPMITLVSYDSLVTGNSFSVDEIIGYATFKNNTDQDIELVGQFVIDQLTDGHLISICTDKCYPAKTSDFIAPGTLPLKANSTTADKEFSTHAYSRDITNAMTFSTPGTNIVTYRISVQGHPDEYVEFTTTFRFE